MTTDSNFQIDTNLLGKYFAGEATAEEAIAVEDWRAKPQNKKEFEQIKKIWLNGNSGYPEVLVTEEWLKFEKLLATKGKIIRWPYKRFIIAASMLAIVISVVVLKKKSGDVPEKTDGNFITKTASPLLTPEILSDGSQVIAGPGSSISFSKDDYKKNREVHLNGEAYFVVVASPDKPFVIHMEDLKIKVIGTSFNVKDNSGQQLIEVEVLSGTVEMYTDANRLVVKKGQTGTYSKQNASFYLSDTIDMNSLSYATKNFYFNDLTLEQIMSYLEKGFGVKIETDNKQLMHCRLTAKFENKPLPYIMDVIVATLNIEYTIQGSKILIKGTGCN